MTSHDALMKKFDDLEVDVTEFIVRHQKIRRDRKALLEACKESLRLCDGEDWLFDLREQLKAAIAQAESDE